MNERRPPFGSQRSDTPATRSGAQPPPPQKTADTARRGANLPPEPAPPAGSRLPTTDEAPAARSPRSDRVAEAAERRDAARSRRMTTARAEAASDTVRKMETTPASLQLKTLVLKIVPAHTSQAPDFPHIEEQWPQAQVDDACRRALALDLGVGSQEIRITSMLRGPDAITVVGHIQQPNSS